MSRTQRPVNLGHRPLQFGDGHRRADPGHDVLTLSVGQEFSKHLILTGRRITSEADPGTAVETRSSQRPSLAP